MSTSQESSDRFAGSLQRESRRNDQAVVHLLNGGKRQQEIQYRAVKWNDGDAGVGVHVGEQVCDRGDGGPTATYRVAGFRQGDDRQIEAAVGVIEKSKGTRAESGIIFDVPDERMSVQNIPIRHRCLRTPVPQTTGRP